MESLRGNPEITFHRLQQCRDWTYSVSLDLRHTNTGGQAEVVL